MELKPQPAPQKPDPPEHGKPYDAYDFLDAALANDLTILRGSGVWRVVDDKLVFAVILVPKQVSTEDTDGQEKV